MSEVRGRGIHEALSDLLENLTSEQQALLRDMMTPPQLAAFAEVLGFYEAWKQNGVSDDRRKEIVGIVREQLAGLVDDDVVGGESLMKEVWEELSGQEEYQVAEDELRGISSWLRRGTK